MHSQLSTVRCSSSLRGMRFCNRRPLACRATAVSSRCGDQLLHAQDDALTCWVCDCKAVQQKTIFVVQNVFKVKPENFGDFEEVWRTRESHLKEMPGFVRFAMLKCTNVPGKYISQTTWETKAAFENWTQSSQFRASHGESSSKRPSVGTMLEGPPSPELYESVTITE